MVGNNVSHSNKKQREGLISIQGGIHLRKQMDNIKDHSLLKTIDKKGISEVLKIAKEKGLL